MNVEVVEMIEDGAECPACLHVIHLFGKLWKKKTIILWLKMAYIVLPGHVSLIMYTQKWVWDQF